MEERIFLSEEEEKAYQKQQEIRKKREEFVEYLERCDKIVFEEYVPELKSIYVAEEIEVKEYKQQSFEVKVDYPEVPDQVQQSQRTFEKVSPVNIPEVVQPKVTVSDFVEPVIEKPTVPTVKIDEVTAEYVQPECKITELPHVTVEIPETDIKVSKAEIKDIPEQQEIKAVETAFKQPEVNIEKISRVIPETVNAAFVMPEMEKIELEKVNVNTEGIKIEFVSPEVNITSVPEVSVQSVDKHFEMPEIQPVKVPEVEVAEVKAEFLAPEVKITALPSVEVSAPDVHFTSPEVKADITLPKVGAEVREIGFTSPEVKVGELSKPEPIKPVHHEFKEACYTISSMPEKTVIPPSPTPPEIFIPKDRMVVPEKCRELYENGIEVPDVTKLLKALNMQ